MFLHDNKILALLGSDKTYIPKIISYSSKIEQYSDLEKIEHNVFEPEFELKFALSTSITSLGKTLQGIDKINNFNIGNNFLDKVHLDLVFLSENDVSQKSWITALSGKPTVASRMILINLLRNYVVASLGSFKDLGETSWTIKQQVNRKLLYALPNGEIYGYFFVLIVSIDGDLIPDLLERPPSKIPINYIISDPFGELRNSVFSLPKGKSTIVNTFPDTLGTLFIPYSDKATGYSTDSDYTSKFTIKREVVSGPSAAQHHVAYKPITGKTTGAASSHTFMRVDFLGLIKLEVSDELYELVDSDAPILKDAFRLSNLGLIRKDIDTLEDSNGDENIEIITIASSGEESYKNFATFIEEDGSYIEEVSLNTGGLENFPQIRHFIVVDENIPKYGGHYRYGATWFLDNSLGEILETKINDLLTIESLLLEYISFFETNLDENGELDSSFVELLLSQNEPYHFKILEEFNISLNYMGLVDRFLGDYNSMLHPSVANIDSLYEFQTVLNDLTSIVMNYLNILGVRNEGYNNKSSNATGEDKMLFFDDFYDNSETIWFNYFGEGVQEGISILKQELIELFDEQDLLNPKLINVPGNSFLVMQESTQFGFGADAHNPINKKNLGLALAHNNFKMGSDTMISSDEKVNFKNFALPLLQKANVVLKVLPLEKEADACAVQAGACPKFADSEDERGPFKQENINSTDPSSIDDIDDIETEVDDIDDIENLAFELIPTSTNFDEFLGDTEQEDMESLVSVNWLSSYQFGENGSIVEEDWNVLTKNILDSIEGGQIFCKLEFADEKNNYKKQIYNSLFIVDCGPLEETSAMMDMFVAASFAGADESSFTGGSNPIIESDLFTEGGEYILPDGSYYIGFYHIHQDGTAMTGEEMSADGKVLTSISGDTSLIRALQETFQEGSMEMSGMWKGSDTGDEGY